MYILTYRNHLYRCFSIIIIFFLTFSLILSLNAAYAQAVMMPLPGTMVPPSHAFVPALLKGMTVHPEDPLKFDFIVDSGNWDDDRSSLIDNRSTINDQRLTKMKNSNLNLSV